MSNALPILLAAAGAATRPDAAQDDKLSPFMTTLCGMGICVLLVWIAYVLMNPEKFKLSNSPGRRNSLTPLHVLGLLLGALFASAALAAGIQMNTELDSDLLAIIMGLTFPALLISGLPIAAYCFDDGAARGMGFTPRRWISDSIRSVITLFAVLPVCVGLLLATRWAIRQLNPDLLNTHEFLTILTRPETPIAWSVMVIAAAVVMAPIGEEILFRGLLQSMLRRYMGRPWIGIVLASILFASVHMTVPDSLPALFALSIALGYSYERTGRLWAPIMIHMLFNAVMIADAVTS